MRIFFGISKTLLTGVLVMAHMANASAPADLVDIQKINPRIRLDIRYATENNFTKHKVYSHACCYLRKATAEKLDKAQCEIEKTGLGLKVFDGYRPVSVQKKFWQLLPDEHYVHNPANGPSKHSRGAAVDVTLVDLKTGTELVMPSPFDDFSERAHRNYNTMEPQAAHNCKLLEDLMIRHGFKSIYTEWWHFNDADWQKYDALDISFEELVGK